ncbi:type I glyceraldehyde-3-phosphate dehydrogenase [Candidatus Roizmanbacteria bacterium RIFOXYB2_FULL_38_10]|uniref:Type I glyceraldehyde-3-phosphate dehydrogenase n=1 Tax=Candidatus Roizmanbacteria bacterium RIFOXYD1_FULL_38_12 TaxID=1802093 RepID=A0A1F7L1U1_9BACT|nr:MAG: type I glyceraldehyde-3-phosphate dehydrogenase [Candidatus Roizmanbacteria bacterium RIFOXYA2_FULL_38_14]OGK64094.1 MAG: type I glyceraldehyde-3-phosphate dehydrogenase [Candidatus Roizmanbacteria bacterium RIFOXYA1_FULL_37_12]OGK65940.1 MAG: type I glyceraldehyde-3-phosphate dehydrogenase [Candidatus Roizmanbacteria bacterium RIFOXYB1_FULL_40_23]OGK67338.1 MAG: type I glyceraldehyde-3-phosphate dehydrogenase [Candidatus Roizmanbacteria bacterium RIFOXYB2_FULL_38_10]OGK70345.1 MAG: typ
MKKIKVGLNGFGRIGRAVTRIVSERNTFDIVAINTRKTSPDMLAYLLQYDSVYRRFGKKVEAVEDGITIDGTKIPASMIADIDAIPWESRGVDVVIDATGAFTKKEDLMKHIKGTVKKVLLTAPSKDKETTHVVLGVNDDKIDWKSEQVISNASCTTNCAAPMFKVIEKEFGVEMGYLTTVHSYTATQSLLDEANKKPDRSRAAALNIGPSTTGAAKAVGKVIPELAGKLDGMAVRVPTPTVSFTDISAVMKKDVTAEEVNSAFKTYAAGVMKGILSYETAPLVSSDFIGDSHSCIFDSNYTKVIGGKLLKIFGWYDNEWGYATRIVDLVERVSDFC